MGDSTKYKIDKYTMQTYGRLPVTFVRGHGSKLWDIDGKEYTDFLAGIAVANLGHANPRVAQAVCNQALNLIHVSNIFYTEPQARVAELLVENSFADRVFFCNSGAEANEGALKLTRRWGKARLNGAFGVITMQGSFHGRTMKTLTATGQDKVKKGFEPLVPGFTHVPWADLEAVERVWDANTCAILVEPVQGEGGVQVPPEGYLKALRELCSRRGALLIFDEIQTGLGRTGPLFAYENWGVSPDIMTLAKGMANGLPAGAVLCTQEVADMFGPGDHGTTFGAGPLVMEAARVVLESLLEPGFLAEAAAVGDHFGAELRGLAAKHPAKIKQVRGLGLMWGLDLAFPGGDLVKALLERGFVTNCTQDTVLRFLPPLIITREEVDDLVANLDELLAGPPAS